MSTGTRYAIALALSVSAAGSLLADEIKLKDGKKLYGVIVGYEDNMFRVKTDFGYVLVEKDKIAAIVPTGDGGKEAASAVPAPAKTLSKPADGKQAGSPTTAGGDSADATVSNKPKISDAPVKPSLPAVTNSGSALGPAIKANSAPENTLAATAPPPAPPKEPELPPNHEDVQGTLYTNFSHGFRMYKAPSWGLIGDARQALPNAIVAMGTSNESTLMVVGQEKMKDSLDATAAAVEKRLKEIYTNYRLISQRKTVVGGSPAAEYRYRGTADDHDWSGTLVVIGRGKEVLTMLGMTYADSDLIQIQENVIARAIASTDFNVPKYSAEK